MTLSALDDNKFFKNESGFHTGGLTVNQLTGIVIILLFEIQINVNYLYLNYIHVCL